ncbi:MAG: TlpA family protein disulfide reductase [Bacteroidetes bacterium]|nr:MAG: TlpA family protein disulfide reductase [Bacteroidota bacterium]
MKSYWTVCYAILAKPNGSKTLSASDSIRKSYWDEYAELNRTKDSAGLQKLGVIWDSLRREDSKNYGNWLLKNPNTDMSLFALERYAYFLYDTAVVKQGLSALPTWATATTTYNNIKKKLTVNKLKLGETIPHFSLPDASGRVFQSADFRGKLLLIDFWASWCGPCRKAHPALKKLYAAYKKQGFEIVSISLDENDAAWRKALSTDELPWLNLIDAKGFAGKIAEAYGVLSIPASYRVDSNGKVTAINEQVEELKLLLDAYFKSKSAL